MNTSQTAQLRSKLFQFIGVVQTVKDGKDLESYANGFLKDIAEACAAEREETGNLLLERIGAARKSAQVARDHADIGMFQYWEARADGINEIYQDLFSKHPLAERKNDPEPDNK